LKESLIESFIEWDIIEIKAVNGIENIELLGCLGHLLSMKMLKYWLLCWCMRLLAPVWKEFLFLRQEAKRIFCVKGASTESERDFSASVYSFLNRRNALLPKKVNMMMVLQ